MNHQDWRTADEILWLDSIGKNHVHTRAMDAAELLARYLEASLIRKDWDLIDRAQVVRHAAQRLARLTAAREVAA
jgi:hypothetical protein